VEAGGWGGLVVESLNGKEIASWLPSNVYDGPNEARGTEREAIYRGLVAVKTRQEYRADGHDTPTVILHTDQKDCQRSLAPNRRKEYDPVNPDMIHQIRKVIA